MDVNIEYFRWINLVDWCKWVIKVNVVDVNKCYFNIVGCFVFCYFVCEVVDDVFDNEEVDSIIGGIIYKEGMVVNMVNEEECWKCWKCVNNVIDVSS